jgi:hypothetical protein
MRRGQYHINPALQRWEEANFQRLMQRKLQGARATVRRACGGVRGADGAMVWTPGVGWHAPGAVGMDADTKDTTVDGELAITRWCHDCVQKQRARCCVAYCTRMLSGLIQTIDEANGIP